MYLMTAQERDMFKRLMQNEPRYYTRVRNNARKELEYQRKLENGLD